MTKDPTKPTFADDREWKRGVWLIAGITCLPVALIAVARLVIG